MFANLKISLKIYGLVAILLVMIIAVAGYGIYSMSAIGTEIENVAERDMPLTEKLTNIMLHQLEQGVLFERGLAVGAELASNPDALPHFVEVEKHFIELGHKVAKELKDAEHQLAELIKVAQTEAQKKEFTHLLEILTKVDAEHADYEALSEQTFKLIERGELLHPGTIAEKIEAEQDQIVKELEGALHEIVQFTAKAMLTMEEHEKSGLMVMMVLAGLALALGAVLSFVIVSAIVKPVNAMTQAMESLSNGDLETQIPAVGQKDEVGEMATAVQVFKDNAIQVKKMQQEQQAAEERAAEEKRQMMHGMADDFESNVGSVVESVASASSQMRDSAASMSTIAEQTTNQSSAVAAASEQASANVQTVAASAEELSSSISEINRQVSRSSQVSSSAMDEATSADAKIKGLAVAVEKIGEIVQLITDIAEQTNLLALNATIESARAGDAGKGFAVVASEVKNLATQTGRATEEISRQIDAVRTETNESVAAIEGVTKTIGEINEISSAIAAAVEQQSAATQEIARNVEQAAAGTQEVNSNITEVTHASGQTGTAAGEIAEAANDLTSQSETLKSQVSKFLTQVRAA